MIVTTVSRAPAEWALLPRPSVAVHLETSSPDKKIRASMSIGETFHSGSLSGPRVFIQVRLKETHQKLEHGRGVGYQSATQVLENLVSGALVASGIPFGWWKQTGKLKVPWDCTDIVCPVVGPARSSFQLDQDGVVVYAPSCLLKLIG